MSAEMPEGFHDGMTLGEARDLLRKLVEEGHRCPCCKQFAKVYKRPIHAAMAADLIRCWREAKLDWLDLTEVVGKRGTGDVTKLRYWQLFEPQEGEREDGSNRVGIWRVTEAGASWLLDRSRVPRYARVYDSRCLGLIGDPVGVLDALGDRFNYAELMGW